MKLFLLFSILLIGAINGRRRPNCDGHEYYDDCYNPCTEKKCPGTGRPGLACSQSCSGGCACQNGYLRNGQGRCVALIQCPPFQCPQYETYTRCGSACEPSCETPNPTVCTEQCVIGCQCNKGYLRRSDKKCVPPNQCNQPFTPPPQQCPPNQYYDNCYNPCTEMQCPAPSFAPPAPVCTPPCTGCCGGCACVQGYYRNLQGGCVKQSQCPPVVTTTPSACPPNQQCPPIATTTPPPPPIICPPNQYYDMCYNPCTEQQCPAPSFAPPAPVCTPPCTGCCGGCACQNGYYRNLQGACVKQSQCPPVVPTTLPTCPPNQYYVNCYNPCTENQCPAPSFAPPAPVCTPPCTGCCGGCACQNGYYRNAQGACVKQSQCPPIATTPPACPPYQYYDNCYNSCTEKKCPGIDPGPLCPSSCTGGCACQNGYVRNRQGGCVKQSQCFPTVTTPPACPPYQYYDNCYNPCTEKKCPGSDGPEPVCPQSCTGGCACQNGYVRNHQGGCVKQSLCPPPPPQTCANVRCGRGTECYMVYPVNCPGCNPHPQCLPVDNCRNKRCPRRQECVLVQQICQRLPCYPIGECRRQHSENDK